MLAGHSRGLPRVFLYVAQIIAFKKSPYHGPRVKRQSEPFQDRQFLLRAISRMAEIGDSLSLQLCQSSRDKSRWWSHRRFNVGIADDHNVGRIHVTQVSKSVPIIPYFDLV